MTAAFRLSPASISQDAWVWRTWYAVGLIGIPLALTAAVQGRFHVFSSR
jgi:hypothetical protein